MNNQPPPNGSGEPPPRIADPCVMVIFGASGDLTKRKLVPSLLNLAAAKLLPEAFAIIGFANNDFNTESFRAQLSQEIKEFASCDITPELWDWFVKRIYYVRGDFKDANAYQQLKQEIAKAEKTHNISGNHFYYLAVAPQFFGEVVRQLGSAGLAQEANGRWARVVIEKPFGRDLESAKALNREIKQILEEPQIYRIDHYLGKETVQNIIIFRFGNGIFEPIWNRRYIDHVEITAAETVGVEQRGGYYETAGALRDMVPNHLFQLVSLTAMEPPISFHADSVRDEQAKALHAIQAPTPEEVLTMAVRGQYGDGQVGDEHAPAYRKEPNVSPESTTETFAGLKLRIDNWRWADVPFYLRTGKRLAKRTTEIAIQFKRAPFQLFRDTPVEALETNRLVLHIQPEEGLSLRFGAKIPGPIMHMGPVEMKFNYVDYFGKTPSTGYERLIYDCMIGDATLFQRADMVEAGWSVITPILDVWRALPPRTFPNYAAGSWGPKEADDLLARDGRRWRHIE
ncbi:MAG TPA: glucose-6-phosphate dehydrogenase [Verrucomicrobiae bacterium]|jgi:glucose-6-phosphate 1-dehydrogenase|nr:glucose-6-phosphate dehydrogenase [Verrucomicrobiae bacterium]